MIARVIKFPIAVKENLKRVLEYEIPRYVPFEKGEIYFDYCLLKEEKDWIHLLAFFAGKTEVDSYVFLFKKMGIQPISFQVSSVAAVNLFLYNKGGSEGETSVLVDMADLFFEMNLQQGKDWKESIHLPVPKEEREKKIIKTIRAENLTDFAQKVNQALKNS